jgi:cytoskeletal protein CcmA (bactofilin family)/ribosomal protein S27E
VAKSSPVKVSVECPHCGFKQHEYAAAKSTMCRQCGSHFAPAAPRPAPIVITRAARPEPRTETSSAAASLMRRFDGLWKSKRSNVIECFDCQRKQEVSGAASSTICPSCSAHIDLSDYKITTSFSRSIRTRGEVHVTTKGDLSSSSVRCQRAIIEGRLRGNLDCAGAIVINTSGKIPGRLSASEIVVEKRSEVQFFRRVHVGNIEIRGRMSGEVVAAGMVTIRKNGVLEGNVIAKAINVEKGGTFSGQVVVGRGDLQQAELLPGESSTGSNPPEGSISLARPLPAT